MYGVFFHDNQEAAFSNYRLWESLGFVLAFAYSKYLCIHVKLIILLVVLIVSLIGYFTAEYVNKSRIDQAYSLADGMALDGRKSDPSAWFGACAYVASEKEVSNFSRGAITLSVL